MGRALFKVLFNLISNIIGIILAPIDIILSGLFPDLNSYINTFNTLYANLRSSVLPYIHYVNYLIPPVTFNSLKIYLYVLVVVYTTNITIHLTLKIFTIIKNIKIW